MRTRTWLVAGVLAAGCARVPEPEMLPSLCELDRPGAGVASDAATWIALLLRGVDPATRRVTSPALDCTGAQVRWQGPALACDDGALARTALPERPLAPEDVITSAAGKAETLVWIVTSRFASGEGMGPVALVDSGGGILRVVALGVLRGFTRSAKLRLERLGAQPVLVAEGELCAGADRTTCLRAARVVPLRGGRFAPDVLLGPDGECLSPAWFELARQESRRAEGRWERLDLGAELAFGPGSLAVEELVTITEVDNRQDGRAVRVLRRAQATRTVRWVNGRMMANDGSLWSRVAGGRQ